jgi:ubiquinone/menaquinone biosynthesis C-methylase UbiE
MWSFRLGIWELALCETRARRQVIRRLAAKKGDSILETGVGNGGNLPLIFQSVGQDGRVDALDVSSESLKIARNRTRPSGTQIELVQGNGSYLPYRTNQYDAVLHVGGINEFGDKKRAIDEMYRVAKPGAKIVICDEGLAPGREKTLLGMWILKCAPGFMSSNPPMKLLPEGIDALKVFWVWQGTHWVIEFRKGLAN